MSTDFAERTVDERELRDALGCFATGIAVVTTRGSDGAPVGLTVNSFNSVSLDPPLVLWSIALTAPSLEAFRGHGAFAVNILAADQGALSTRFATPANDKFEGVSWRTGRHEVPLIEGVVAQFECVTHARYPGGDHEIILGEVVALRSDDRPPLIICRGRTARVEPV